MSFPDKVYTSEEVQAAKALIDQGYKHNLVVEGDEAFKAKVNQTLDLIKTTGYYDFLRTYVRKIFEINGITQLRETEAEIWANKFAVDNPVDVQACLSKKPIT